jgi:hypothetical protein
MAKKGESCCGALRWTPTDMATEDEMRRLLLQQHLGEKLHIATTNPTTKTTQLW